MITSIKKEIAGSKERIHRMILKDKYNKTLSVSMSLRSRRFDRYAVAFILRNPQGSVINLGCGLDTRFERIDNGKINWFDIDYAEVIELRKRYIGETERHHLIADNILNHQWMKQISAKGPYLILAEGVFVYLTEKDVKDLLNKMHDVFGEAELVCEVTNKYWVDKMKSAYMQFKFKHQLGMTGGASFTFGIPNSRYFEQWNPQFRLIDEWTYFDEKEPKMGWYNLLSNIEVLRKVQWTMHHSI
jgi:O-Methyltransferase involved in polyketide biosynthesis